MKFKTFLANYSLDESSEKNLHLKKIKDEIMKKMGLKKDEPGIYINKDGIKYFWDSNSMKFIKRSDKYQSNKE